jgi:hypothetical protein
VVESESTDSSDSTRLMHSALAVSREEKTILRTSSVLIDRALPYEMLALEDKKALTQVYRHYQRTDASRKKAFDTWCLSYFQGKLLWDAAGNVTIPLTEQAVSDIVDAWSAQVLAHRRSARSPSGTPESGSPERQPLLGLI